MLIPLTCKIVVDFENDEELILEIDINKETRKVKIHTQKLKNANLTLVPADSVCGEERELSGLIDYFHDKIKRQILDRHVTQIKKIKYGYDTKCLFEETEIISIFEKLDIDSSLLSSNKAK